MVNLYICLPFQLKCVMGYDKEPISRVYLSGYDEERVTYGKYENVDKIELKSDFEIVKTGNELKRTKVVSVRHPNFYVEGCVPPKPLTDSDEMVKGGLMYRIGRKRPAVDRKLVNELYRFTNKLVKDLIKRGKITIGNPVMSVNEWMDTTTYSYKQKEKMRKLINSIDAWSEINRDKECRLHEIRAFVKEEFYGEYKPDRNILPRNDIAKCIMGPVFKTIDKAINLGSICKSDNPSELRKKFQKIYNNGQFDKYAVTDYTAWEASQTPELMKAVEWPLYKAILGNEWEDFKDIGNILLGKNKIVFRSYVAFIKGTRMSGEMNTSLGNTWMNYVIMRFVSSKQKINTKSLHVGDDGLICLKQKDHLDLSLFDRLGLELKIDYKQELWQSDLCKIHYSPNGNTFRDPAEILVKFGWFAKKFKNSRVKILNELLVSKAICYLFLLRNCPVITSICLNIVKTYGITYNRFKLRFGSDAYFNYLRTQHDAAEIFSCLKNYEMKIDNEDRYLYCSLFNVSIKEQIRLETCDVTKPIHVSYGLQIPQIWFDNFKDYSFIDNIKQNNNYLVYKVRKELREFYKLDAPYKLLKVLDYSVETLRVLATCI